VGIVQVVGRADTHVVHLHSLTLELINVPIEALVLDKKIGIGEVAIDNTYTIVPI
jgi:hypothetical protein